MSVLSDLIETFIKDMISQNGTVNFRRCELAKKFKCAPSQINYVLTTRFSPSRGYVTTSRRGEGGYISVTRKDINKVTYLSDLIDSRLQTGINMKEATEVVDGLFQTQLINDREKDIILLAVSDKSLPLDPNLRNEVRAKMLRQILFGVV